MHCNVMIHNEIFFKIIIGVVMQRNCLDTIVLGGNKHFPGGVHYPDAIFQVAIIWGYISVVNYSARQQFEHQLSTRANHLGDNFRVAILGEQLSRGEIVLFPF